LAAAAARLDERRLRGGAVLCRATELVRLGARDDVLSLSLSPLMLLLRSGLLLGLLFVLLLLASLLLLWISLLLLLTSLLLLAFPLVPGLEPPGDSSGTSLICLGIGSGLIAPVPVADLGVEGPLLGFDASCTLPPPGWAM